MGSFFPWRAKATDEAGDSGGGPAGRTPEHAGGFAWDAYAGEDASRALVRRLREGAGRVWRAVDDFLERTFVPREIILRSEGKLSYLRLSSRLQKGAASALLLLACWGLFASTGFFVQRDWIDQQDQLIGLQDLAYLDLEDQIDQALSREARLEKRVAELSGSLERELATTASLREQRADLERRNDGLWQGLTDLREAQQGVLTRFSERVALRADFVEETVALTGLDPETLIYDVTGSPLGQGGPLIPVGKVAADLEPDHGFVAAVGTLNDEWRRWSALRTAIRSLPLSAPLEQYWVSSGFGEREDPFTGQMATHAGLDLVAPLGSKVLATAPGTVTFAGRHGRYGNLVEIDHGNGIATRYAHLSKVVVETGAEVEQGQQIGVMGNSGRSTGPHVHYEVRYGDEALDPMKFLLAGHRLYKG